MMNYIANLFFPCDRVRFSQIKSGDFKIKVFSRNYSDLCQSLNLHPYSVTGFSDGESSFILRVRKNSKSKIGWSDIDEKIIPFLNKYPVHGIKALDFADFCEAAEIMKVGGHLTEEGFNKLVIIKNRMNRNRTETNSPLKPHSFQSFSQESKLGENILSYLSLKAYLLQAFKNNYMKKYILISFVFVISCILICYFGDNFIFVLDNSNNHSRMFSTINFNLDKLYAVYSEIYTNGYFIIWLNIISIISIISGIFVIITRNPVIAVLYLIALFLEISGYLLLIGMSFIGLSYILVYISAVSILFLFTLMLINIRISELHTDNYNSMILGLIVSAIFYSSISLNLNFFTLKDSSTYKAVLQASCDKW